VNFLGGRYIQVGSMQHCSATREQLGKICYDAERPLEHHRNSQWNKASHFIRRSSGVCDRSRRGQNIFLPKHPHTNNILRDLMSRDCIVVVRCEVSLTAWVPNVNATARGTEWMWAVSNSNDMPHFLVGHLRDPTTIFKAASDLEPSGIDNEAPERLRIPIGD